MGGAGVFLRLIIGAWGNIELVTFGDDELL